jgi:hypothetical protein
MAGSIKDILIEHMHALMMNPQMEGLEKHIADFMSNFTKPEGLPALLLWMPKVDSIHRFELLNIWMKSRIPKRFPADNVKLWHSLVTMIHSVIAITTRNAVPDSVMAQALQTYSEGGNPYKLTPN